MSVIDLQDFRSFVQEELEGKRLRTLKRHRPFTVEVANHGFIYIPHSTHKVWWQANERIELYLQENTPRQEHSS